MKKLLAFTLFLASMGLLGLSTDAKAIEASTSPAITRTSQLRVQVRPNWRYSHRVRVVTSTRIVHFGRRVYRETYQIRYFPNGRTQTFLISRVRIR